LSNKQKILVMCRRCTMMLRFMCPFFEIRKLILEYKAIR
jgi:hypothetical protein